MKKQFPVLGSPLHTASRLLLLLLFLNCFNSQNAEAQQTLATFSNPSFSAALVVTGVRSPTTMAFAPASDGRIFVCQEDGNLRVVKNGALLATPFISLPVNTEGERGLLGIAIDPNFLINHYIYLYYTLPDASHNRVSRFTANGDVVVPGSETVLLDLDPLIDVNHNGGAMHFGRDGKLYIAVGDNTRRLLAQDLDSYMGKILRINSDGSVPGDNPFAGTQNSAQRQRVWNYGERNPFTFSIEPGTGKIFVNNVGDVRWEEINDATVAGRNHGWPTQPGGEGYTAGPGQTEPIYAYPHQANNPDGTGCAITGGTFFSPTATNYPAQYRNKYFFMDYCGKWINYFDPNSATPRTSRMSFALNIGHDVVGIQTGPDGNLYYLARNGAALYKIVYTAASSAPVITTQPQNVTVTPGTAVAFSVEAAGSTPLSYQWQKGGVNLPGATASIYRIDSPVAADAGQYRVIVSNSVGSATSIAATLTITAPNSAPTAHILTPAGGTTYVAGNSISFSGEGSDPEDGLLPASAFSWVVRFYHNTHSHPHTAIPGVTSGTFATSATNEEASDVFYRIFLIVTDNGGRTDTSFVDIQPQKSTITLVSSPASLPLIFNDITRATPFSVVSVEGFQNKLGAASPQTVNGVTYEFVSWSDGGAQDHTINTPTNDVTYTATFKVVSPPASGQAVTSLTLFNADTDLPIAGYDPLPNNATLNLATLPTRNLNIRANTNPATVGSVRFAYDANANYKVEGLAPYAIAGDNGTTASGTPNYNPWTPAVGSHTLTVTPYTAGGGGGTAGTPLTVNFTVTNTPPATGGGSLRTPENPANTTAGLTYGYYQGVWGALPNFANLTPVSTGTTAAFELTPRLRDDEFAFRYTGYVTVPTDGTYSFYTSSDDGSQLFIGSTLVVDNDGLHGSQERTGQIGLQAGTHAITVTFFERGGGQVLNVSYAGPNLSKTTLPAMALSHAGTAARASALPTGAGQASVVQLYPNPAANDLSIKLESVTAQQAQVDVYNAYGFRVASLSQATRVGQNELRLSLKALPEGVYSVTITNGAERSVQRLMVVK